MYDTSKKRSRRALSHGSNDNLNNTTNNNNTMNNTMSMNMNMNMNMNNSTKRTNRTMFSAAVLALATLFVNMDTVAVAFTPAGTGRASLSSGPVSSSAIIGGNNNKDVHTCMNVAMKIYPTTTTKRRRRQQVQGRQHAQVSGSVSVSSTIVDDDSTAADHGVSIMTSPILNQQRRSRLSANAAENVVVLDDGYFHHNNNNNNNNELAVQVVLNNDIVSFPSNVGSTSTSRLVSTTNKRNRNTKMVRPKSRNSSPRKKAQIKKNDPKKKTSSSSSSTSLLTRDEERKITYSIRDLRKAVCIRDELVQEKEEWSSFHPSFGDDEDFPTETDWAKACDLDVLTLRRVMSEGQEARSVLVSANAGLVTSIAKRHYHALKQVTNNGGGIGTILTLQDMIQEGNLGLMKAAERFEPERGWRFSTYATYWIRQRILQSITDSSRVIRLPAHVTATLQKLNKARKDMSAEIGRMPSDAELAHYMKISVDKLRKISDKARAVVSLESPLRMGSNHKAEMDRRTIGDSIASDAPTPEEDAQHKSMQRDIRAVVNELADREREVLVLRFGLDNGEPMSTSKTAAQLGITTDRVRYVETRALNKLRSPQRNYRLKDYLGGGHHAAIEEKQQQKLSAPTAAKSSSNYRRNQDQKQKKTSAQEKFWFF